MAFNGNTKGYGRNYQNNQNIEKEFKFSKNGFTDAKGNLREELMTVEAKEIAEYFKSDRLTKSQLRAFYNEVKALKNRLSINKSEDKFAEIYPLILMMKSKVAYRASKDKKKMDGIQKFLNSGIDQIQKENKNGNGRKAFENFAILFEVVVGYAYGSLSE